MHPRSFLRLSLVCLCCVVLAVVSWVMTPSYRTSSSFGQPLFPGLLEQVNDVAVMSVEHGGQTVTFVKDAQENWTLMEAEHYPADKERIRNTLIGIAGLQKIEPKTSLPEFYEDIRVEDNSAPDAKSYLVTLLDGEGNELIALLVGKSTRGVRWDGTGYFVRFPQESQSWLVRGSLDVTGDTRTWLVTRLLPLKKGELASVSFLDETKKREIIFRRLKPQLPLQAEYMSDPYFVTTQEYISKAEEALMSLDFVDVAKRPEGLENYDPFLTTHLQTFDKMSVSLMFYLVDQRPFVAVSFDADEDASPSTRKEAARLDNRHSNWFYQIPNAKVNALLPFRPLPETRKKSPVKEPVPVKQSEVKNANADKLQDQKQVQKEIKKEEASSKKETTAKKTSSIRQPSKTATAKTTVQGSSKKTTAQSRQQAKRAPAKAVPQDVKKQELKTEKKPAVEKVKESEQEKKEPEKKEEASKTASSVKTEKVDVSVSESKTSGSVEKIEIKITESVPSETKTKPPEKEEKKPQ